MSASRACGSSRTRPRSTRARWHGDDVTVLRLAPDDAFAIGATDVEIDDEHAIVESEPGFAGAWLPVEAVAHHLEWSLPTERPALAQGAVANVPARSGSPTTATRS